MQISPRRRQRALKVHAFRQKGRSLRNTGKLLNVSHTTVLSDLKLIETNWSDVAEQSADDFLLEQFSLLQHRVRYLLQRDMAKTLAHLDPASFARIYTLHKDELAMILRETRRILVLLQDRAERHQRRPDQLDPELDFPLEELTAALNPARSAKSKDSSQVVNAHHGLPKHSKPNHPTQPIPRKTLEIPKPAPQEKIPDQPPTELSPEQLQQEAETFLRNYNNQELQTAAAGG